MAQTEIKAGSFELTKVGQAKPIGLDRATESFHLNQKSAIDPTFEPASTTDLSRVENNVMIIFKREFHYLFAAVFGWFVLQAVAFFLILRRVATKLAPASFQRLDHRRSDKGAPSGTSKASKSPERRV